MATKYRNKSTGEVVEAMRFNPRKFLWPRGVYTNNLGRYEVCTPEGVKEVWRGAWIVTDSKINNHIFTNYDFKKTFEREGVKPYPIIYHCHFCLKQIKTDRGYCDDYCRLGIPRKVNDPLEEDTPWWDMVEAADEQFIAE